MPFKSQTCLVSRYPLLTTILLPNKIYCSGVHAPPSASGQVDAAITLDHISPKAVKPVHTDHLQGSHMMALLVLIMHVFERGKALLFWLPFKACELLRNFIIKSDASCLM